MDSEDGEYCDDEMVNSDDEVHMDSEDIDDDDDDHDAEEMINANSKCENYTVLSSEDIRKRQEKDIVEITNVLSVSRGWAAALLIHYKWRINAVHDAWFSDGEKVRTTVGLLPETEMAKHPKRKKFTCGICFDEFNSSKIHTAHCTHPFCTSCWGSYISESINNDAYKCLTLRCPDPSCSAAVGESMISALVSKENWRKYSSCLIRSYVEARQTIKYCPSPGCDYAVEFAVGSDNCDVSCNCGNSFCWNCAEDAHRPVDCDTVAKWIFKNSDESENVNWILVNSKACPKCNRPIEKNMGCMHMTCSSPCSYEFCWVCLGPWRNHDNRACNGYSSPKKTGEDASEKKRLTAKKLLDRYAHYYERWQANHNSRMKAVKDLKEVEAKQLDRLTQKQGQTGGQLKFITKAWQQIIECRRVLKWTYAYGYYLPDHEDAKRQLFEYLQGQAESCLERLHHCAEKDLQVYLDAESPSKDFYKFQQKLAQLTSVTGNYFENLVQALETGLSDVNSLGMENPGSWSCRKCTYFNIEHSTVCQMCSSSL